MSKRKILHIVSSLIPFWLLKFWLPARFILYGHLVYSKNHIVSHYYRYPCLEEFHKFIKSLQKEKYTFVDLKAFLEDDGKKKILMTFDDGYRAVLENLHPYMMKNNLPYLLFILTDPLDKPDFYIKTIKPRADGNDKPEQLFLSTDDIKLLRKDGVHIGFHTRSHPKVTRNDIMNDEILKDLTIPEKYSSLFSHPLCFAYPYYAPDNFNFYNQVMRTESNFKYFFDTKGFGKQEEDHFFRVSIDAEIETQGKNWMKDTIKWQLLLFIIKRLKKAVLASVQSL